MNASALSVAIVVAAALSACSGPQGAATVGGATGPDALYAPAHVAPGILEYAPDRSTFAPVLTERFAYPTQAQANAAYLRTLSAAPEDLTLPASIRLFGCQPGALDGETARVTRYRAPVALCAVDFLDAAGRRLWREPANFIYAQSVWSLEPVYPPKTPVVWRHRESSPKDFWWWVPGRPRYE